MHALKTTALAVSAIAALTAGTLALAAPAASASTTTVATTHLTNRQDSGNNSLGGNVWATDTLTRTATLVDTGADPNRSGFDIYTASLSDTGTFTTNSNVGNPNGLNPTTPISGTVTGTVTGTGTFTQFDVPSTVHADASLVPATMDGNGTSSSVWPSLFFPAGTDFECPGPVLTAFRSQAPPNPFGTGGCGAENTFSYTYTSCSEKWVDANTDNDGNAVGETAAEQAIIGGISGKACPASSPSPSPVVPKGGVQTGGGTAPGSTWFPVGLGLLVFALVGIAGAVVSLRRRSGQRG